MNRRKFAEESHEVDDTLVTSGEVRRLKTFEKYLLIGS